MQTDLSCEQILDAFSFGVILTDDHGKIEWVNPQALKLLGSRRRNLVGKKLQAAIPAMGILAAKCLKGGESLLNQHVFIQNTNYICHITPIAIETRIGGCLCALEAIPGYKLSANQLESYSFIKKQLDSIFHFAPYGFWVCDGQGRVTRISQAAEKLIGIKAEEIVGQKVETLVENNIIDRVLTPYILDAKKPVNKLLHVRRTNRYIMSMGTPVLDEAGNIAFLVVFEHDMTTLRELQQQLEKSRTVSDKYKDELTELHLLEAQQQEVIAESDAMRQVHRTALKLARLEASNILILGESGTGKGLLAKIIHKNSRRCEKPFIQINCAALPEGLLEAELFGYEKGAFTGASENGKVGLFELAHEGTLFLDEIGDLPLPVQAKLLKCLDDSEFMHLGGLKPIRINCTLIAATNRDLKTLVKEGRFRKDLLYRLNAFSLRIPPLKERPEDILALSHYFLKKYNRQYQMNRRLSARAFKMLQSYFFPGNVRELGNILKNAVVMSEEAVIDALIPDIIFREEGREKQGLEKYRQARTLPEKVNRFEKEVFKETLTRCKSTRRIADRLGISQTSVVRKLKKYGLTTGMS